MKFIQIIYILNTFEFNIKYIKIIIIFPSTYSKKIKKLHQKLLNLSPIVIFNNIQGVHHIHLYIIEMINNFKLSRTHSFVYDKNIFMVFLFIS